MSAIRQAMTAVSIPSRNSTVSANDPLAHQGRYLFDSGLFADARVCCGDRTWNVHRAILAPRCQFFRACFTSDFREAIPETTKTMCKPDHPENHTVRLVRVQMDGDDSEALERMLRWIYTYSYPSQTRTPETTSVPALSAELTESSSYPALPTNFWTTELNLILIADKYDLQPLLLQSASNFLAMIEATISDPMSKDQCWNFLSAMDDIAGMLEMLFDDGIVGQALSTIATTLELDIRTEVLEYMGGMVARFIHQYDRLKQLLHIEGLAVGLIQVLSGVTSDVSSRFIGPDIEENGTLHWMTEGGGDRNTNRFGCGIVTLTAESSPKDWYSYDTSSSNTSLRSDTSSDDLDISVTGLRRKIQDRRIFRRHRGGKKVKQSADGVDAVPQVETVSGGSNRIHIPMNEDSDLD